VLRNLVCVLLLITAAAASVQPPPTAAASRSYLEAAFARASGEFHVPEAVLLSLSYHLTLWQDHGSAPSTDGGYGLMDLTHVNAVEISPSHGHDEWRSVRRDAALHTLDLAAHLIHRPLQALIHDPSQNVRGGAALLARYDRQTLHREPRSIGDWYRAVARYSGYRGGAARDFADRVYRTLATGTARMTATGLVRLNPVAGVHTILAARAKGGHQAMSGQLECPSTITCRYVPAAYAIDTPGDPTDYGNYNVANRPADHLAIRYIVIHDTEGSSASAISAFQDPHRYASANYVIRASDGLVTQMVPNKDIAWHAGNYYVNMHAIGIEHEGIAIDGATWYTEDFYETSAALVRYLATRYHVPLDRAHIVGHDEVPGETPATQSSQHWDPGPFWNWQRYMELLGKPLPVVGATDSAVITINPPFDQNMPAVTSCATCPALPSQPANFVYLRTAPQLTAPLISDRAIRSTGVGTTEAADWGDKAVTGQKFVLVDQEGDWSAIDYGGREAWFYNPAAQPVAVPTSGKVITPLSGLREIPVYGRASPNLAEYPAAVHQPDRIVPLTYTLKAGQQYVAVQRVYGDFYYAPTMTQRIVVRSHVAYYQIFFNHRFAFVKVAQVTVLPQVR
jgi:hypothetical protein